MPTHGPDLSKLSTTRLAWLARCKVDTATKKLQAAGISPLETDGRTVLYDPRDALPVLLGVEGLDLSAERARLAREQADAQALRNAVLRGELVPAGEMDKALIAICTTVSARLQTVPAKVAAELAAESTTAGCHAIAEREIHAALHDLADAGREALERAEVSP